MSEKAVFKNMQPIFKSGVRKGEDMCYKINDPPVSLNEGNYRVNYEIVDPKKKMAYVPKKA